MKTYKINIYSNYDYAFTNYFTNLINLYINKYNMCVTYCNDYILEKCDIIFIPLCLLDFSESIEGPFIKLLEKLNYKTNICILSSEPHGFPFKDDTKEHSENILKFIEGFITSHGHKFYAASHFIDSDNNLFYPYIMLNLQLIHNKLNNKKTKFCAIISSTESIHRRRFINLLSKYKNVDVYGCLSDNINNHNLNEETVNKIMSEYKFTLAIENSKSIENEYYITEKIVKSYYWGGIPIYFGSDFVNTMFNENTFINCNHLSDNEILNIIKKIDNDDKLYTNMISINPFKSLSANEYEEMYKVKQGDFIRKILEQS